MKVVVVLTISVFKDVEVCVVIEGIFPGWFLVPNLITSCLRSSKLVPGSKYCPFRVPDCNERQDVIVAVSASSRRADFTSFASLPHN